MLQFLGGVTGIGRSVGGAAFSSASEKNRRLRSRAAIQRCTSCTPTSTFALSRGLSPTK